MHDCLRFESVRDGHEVNAKQIIRQNLNIKASSLKEEVRGLKHETPNAITEPEASVLKREPRPYISLSHRAAGTQMSKPALTGAWPPLSGQGVHWGHSHLLSGVSHKESSSAHPCTGCPVSRVNAKRSQNRKAMAAQTNGVDFGIDRQGGIIRVTPRANIA